MIREIPVQRDCPHCGRVEFTAAVSVIIVWAHGLRVAAPLIPEDGLRVCGTGPRAANQRLASPAFEGAAGNPRPRPKGTGPGPRTPGRDFHCAASGRPWP